MEDFPNWTYLVRGQKRNKGIVFYLLTWIFWLLLLLTWCLIIHY